MKINKPTYLIAELSGDVVPVVLDLRKRFNPERICWPVDITIVGSSGIGTLQEGQSIKEVITLLEPVIKNNGFSDVIFTHIDIFVNTGIYYFAPERKKFDILHQAVKDSGVGFNENPWPYTPHCTLSANNQPTTECNALCNSINIPKNVYIKCFSLYQPEPYGGIRTYEF